MRRSFHLQLVDPPALDPCHLMVAAYAGEGGAANSAAVRQSISVSRIAHNEARV